tara:strand:- start:164 stop:532 length:369 start_codon:yes stop_codon:yes gene_type:complete
LLLENGLILYLLVDWRSSLLLLKSKRGSGRKGGLMPGLKFPGIHPLQKDVEAQGLLPDLWQWRLMAHRGARFMLRRGVPRHSWKLEKRLSKLIGSRLCQLKTLLRARGIGRGAISVLLLVRD